MKLVKRRYEDVVILSLSGDFDGGRVPVVRERVDAMMAEGDVKFVLDGPQLEYVSSAAIGYMVRLAREAEAHQGELVLARPSEFLKHTLVTLNLLSRFPVYEDLQGALLHLVKGADVATMDLSSIDRDDSLIKNVPVSFHVLGGEQESEPDATGRIVNIREDSLLIRREPTPDEDLAHLSLVPGTMVGLRFQQPFVIRDHEFEVEGEVEQVNRLEKDGVDHGISFRVAYRKVKDEDRTRLNQFVRDQALWRVEREI